MVSILVENIRNNVLVEADQIHYIAGFVRIYRNNRLFMQVPECSVLKVMEK